MIFSDEEYGKLSLEWEEFNQKYKIYAKNKDALPAFELLNPKFMAELYDRKLNYNLEVIDNVIYIFAKVDNIEEEDYAEIFEVLSLAFKELKL